MGNEQRICVGEIVAAHGLRGEVKIKSFTAVPEDLAGYAPLTDEAGEKEFPLRLRSSTKNMLIASIKGVDNRAAAEKLRDMKLYVSRAQLPQVEKGRFYVADLRGLKAVDEAGIEFARVTDVHNFGAGDILVIENAEGREWLLPFKPPFAHTPDVKAGQVVVNIPEDFPFSENRNQKPEVRNQKRKKQV